MRKLIKLPISLILFLISATSLGANENYSLNEDNFAEYISAFVALDYDVLIEKYYSNDIVIDLSGETLDLEALIEFEKTGDDLTDFTLDVFEIIGDDDGIAIQAIQEITILKDQPDFQLGASKAGDIWRSHLVNFYTLENGKISRIQVFNISSEKVE